MKKNKCIAWLLMAVVAIATCQPAFGQAVQAKKCAKCGKPLSACAYKGKHPSISESNKSALSPLVIGRNSYISDSSKSVERALIRNKTQKPFSRSKQKCDVIEISYEEVDAAAEEVSVEDAVEIDVIESVAE